MKLIDLYKIIENTIRGLQNLKENHLSSPPLLILNKHCQACQYQQECEQKAKEQDHISLLDGISTLKQIKKYQKKGIFSVNQLSYTYRPRKQRKRSRKPPSLQLSLELQSLMIRIGKIYVHDNASFLQRNHTEIFLDIEGNPDNQSFYLFGILLNEDGKLNYHPFWVDSAKDEKQIWSNVIDFLRRYPGSIYHYGSYDAKATLALSKRYDTDINDIYQRLVNLNSYIYGKIYFPLRSNSLKAIDRYLGAKWTDSNASGLQSLIWRYHWEITTDDKYKRSLITYNEEDCLALKTLAEFLSKFKERNDSIFDIDCFVSSKKSINSTVKNPIHNQLEGILKFAHSNSYKKLKIKFRQSESDENNFANPI